MKKLMTILMFAMLIFAACKKESTTGTVVVSNYTGYAIIVDVNDGNGNWIDERTLYSGSSTTYSNVEEGAIDGAAIFVGESTWFYTNRSLTAGSTIYIDWALSKKSAEISKNMNGTLIPSKGNKK